MTNIEIEKFVKEELQKLTPCPTHEEVSPPFFKKNFVKKLSHMELSTPREKKVRLFTEKQLSLRHKDALEKIKKYCTDKFQNIISIVVHGSIGIKDSHPFSDVDTAIILATTQKTIKQEFLIHEDIILSLTFYDLKSFARTNVHHPFNGMMDRISIQKAAVLYDPLNCWQDIATITLNTLNPYLLNLKILNKLWPLCIVYLGKIIASADNKNFMYLVESSTLLANNVAHIILIINEIPCVANRHLYKQAINCPLKPEKFEDTLNGLLGIKHQQSFEQRALHGLKLCQDLQKILSENRTYKNLYTLPISLLRYEQALQKILPPPLT